MTQKLLLVFIFLSAVAAPSFGDNTATVVGAGYIPAVPIGAAPGQLVTVFVTGFTTPAVTTGTASPSPAASTNLKFGLNFDYRPNAAASPGAVAFG